jgi:hypothetical protein
LLGECQARVESGSAKDIETLKPLLGTADVGPMTFAIARAASSAIISIGPSGVEELRAFLERGEGQHYQEAIIESLWRAATRQMLPGGLTSSSDTVGPFTINEITRTRAKAVLDDLIIQAEYDEEFRGILMAAVSSDDFSKWAEKDHHTPAVASAAHERRSLGSYMFSVFRAASITLTEGLIGEFASMVSENLPESAYQNFLTAHPVFLDPLAAEVMPQERLGTEFVADFIIRRHDSRYVAVEIEKPVDRIFTKSDHFTASFTHAVGQVLDFQGWANENISYAQKKLPNIENPAGLVVIGRRSALSPRQEARLRRWTNNSSNIEVLTFDDLVTRSRLLHRSLRFP